MEDISGWRNDEVKREIEEWKKVKLEEDEEALTTVLRNLGFIYFVDVEPLKSLSRMPKSQGYGVIDYSIDSIKAG